MGYIKNKRRENKVLLPFLKLTLKDNDDEDENALYKIVRKVIYHTIFQMIRCQTF